MPVAERFELRVARCPMSGCWLWLGSLSEGYGQFLRERAHRAAYRLFVGAIPDGMHVLHKCDVKSCANPKHLYLGTHADNMADMGLRTAARGERGGMAKLTTAQVSEIRVLAGTMSQRLIGSLFGVDGSTVSNIVAGKTWQ